MAGCTVENWTLEDLASALKDMHKDNKRIAVPMFQRGERWGKQQQRDFIDSVIKGYPVGTMLFYESYEDGKPTYILVDGLQRGTSIKAYMDNPTEFFYDKNISDEFCKSILQIVGTDQFENYGIIRSILTSFIKQKKSFKNLQYYEPAKEISSRFQAEQDVIGELIEVIDSFFEERQSLHERIALTVIPIVIYRGEEENLPEIFDRINSKGTPLDQYEVYAASWPIDRRFKIQNTDIVECAIKKYDAFIKDGFFIHGYDRETMRKNKEVTAFEYLFGLSKYIVSKFDILEFPVNYPDDTVNPLGFELVNACLNDKDRIKTLYNNIYGIEDIDAFEKALYSAIEFVQNTVSPIVRFKGNCRSNSKKFHSKYQIMSMISTTFKEMYAGGNYNTVSDNWNSRKDLLSKNIRLYYVYDIITNYWRDGGPNKMLGAAKPNRYAVEITPRAWRTALDGFYEKSMQRSEAKQFASPKSGEYVLLNCIYLNTFTAMDQLSLDKFDVEHIAPKEQMKKLIAKTEGEEVGLPVSCVANLCYLPEYVNRSKRDKNFYQDQRYLQTIDLDEVERKYSFTTRDDLEWMDMPYQGAKDFEELKQFYVEFCDSRFEIMKKLFCKAMEIDYDAMNVIPEETANQSFDSNDDSLPSTSKDIEAECIDKVQEYLGEHLYKTGRSIYRSDDGSKGFILCSSKAYRQGEREKYWYAYRKAAVENIKDCAEKNIIYICRDAGEIVIYPLEDLEKLEGALNFSFNEDGGISHYHIVFFRDVNGQMTQLLSKPEIREIDINKYKL